MIRCYVIDDEEHASRIIANYIEETDGLELIGTENKPLSALNNILEGRITPDITFLDVDMPKISGIELAGMITNRTSIIFTTAFQEYAVNAFEQEAVDYLVKPVSYLRFLKAVNRVRTNRGISKENKAENSDNDYFFVKINSNGSSVKISVDEIVLIEARHNYVELFTTSLSYLAYLTLQGTEEQLPKNKFIRVQKSFLVNIDMITRVDGNSITMNNSREIVIGKSYRKEFSELISRKSLLTRRHP